MKVTRSSSSGHSDTASSANHALAVKKKLKKRGPILLNECENSSSIHVPVSKKRKIRADAANNSWLIDKSKAAKKKKIRHKVNKAKSGSQSLCETEPIAQHKIIHASFKLPSGSSQESDTEPRKFIHATFKRPRRKDSKSSEVLDELQSKLRPRNELSDPKNTVIHVKTERLSDSVTTPQNRNISENIFNFDNSAITKLMKPSPKRKTINQENGISNSGEKLRKPEKRGEFRISSPWADHFEDATRGKRKLTRQGRIYETETLTPIQDESADISEQKKNAFQLKAQVKTEKVTPVASVKDRINSYEASNISKENRKSGILRSASVTTEKVSKTIMKRRATYELDDTINDIEILKAKSPDHDIKNRKSKIKHNNLRKNKLSGSGTSTNVESRNDTEILNAKSPDDEVKNRKSKIKHNNLRKHKLSGSGTNLNAESSLHSSGKNISTILFKENTTSRKKQDPYELDNINGTDILKAKSPDDEVKNRKSKRKRNNLRENKLSGSGNSLNVESSLHMSGKNSSTTFFEGNTTSSKKEDTYELDNINNTDILKAKSPDNYVSNLESKIKRKSLRKNNLSGSGNSLNIESSLHMSGKNSSTTLFEGNTTSRKKEDTYELDNINNTDILKAKSPDNDVSNLESKIKRKSLRKNNLSGSGNSLNVESSLHMSGKNSSTTLFEGNTTSSKKEDTYELDNINNTDILKAKSPDNNVSNLESKLKRNSLRQNNLSGSGNSLNVESGKNTAKKHEVSSTLTVKFLDKDQIKQTADSKNKSEFPKTRRTYELEEPIMLENKRKSIVFNQSKQNLTSNEADLSPKRKSMRISNLFNMAPWDEEMNKTDDDKISVHDSHGSLIVQRTKISHIATPPSGTSTPLVPMVSYSVSAKKSILKKTRNFKQTTKSESSIRGLGIQNKTISKTPVRTRMPNYALIHKQAMDKMENLSEHVERKAGRAKFLLSGTKPRVADISQSSVSKIDGNKSNTTNTDVDVKKSKKQLRFGTISERDSVDLNEPKTPTAIKMRLQTPKRIKSASNKGIIMPQKTPLFKTETPEKVKRINIVERKTPVKQSPRKVLHAKAVTISDKKKVVETKKPELPKKVAPAKTTCKIPIKCKPQTPKKICPPVGSTQNPHKHVEYTRFGFKIPTEHENQKLEEVKPSKRVITKKIKEDEIKAVSTKAPVLKNKVDDRRNHIKGVRSNRRFDLLMNMRQK